MSDASQEQVLFKGSSSPLMNLGTFVLGTLTTVGAFVAAFVVPPPYSYALFGVALLALVWMLARWLLIKVRVYEVTTERIRITDGVVTRRTDELELYRVKDTTLLEPLLLRLFSLGHLEITTNDTSTPLIRLEAVQNVRSLREDLRKAVEVCRDRKRVRLAELE